MNGSEPHPSDDVYSLACIAYELLSGEHPFGGRSAVLARANGRRPRNIPGLTRKQMQSLNRALLWGRGERKIDVVDLLAGLGCSEAPNRLVPPEALVAHDSTRSVASSRAWATRVHADGRCGNRCVHLSRAQPRAAASRGCASSDTGHTRRSRLRPLRTTRAKALARSCAGGCEAFESSRSAEPASGAEGCRASPPATTAASGRRCQHASGRAGVRQGHVRCNGERWLGAHRGRAPRLDAAARELPLEPAQQLGGAGHGLRRHRARTPNRFPPAPSRQR